MAARHCDEIVDGPNATPLGPSSVNIVLVRSPTESSTAMSVPLGPLVTNTRPVEGSTATARNVENASGVVWRSPYQSALERRRRHEQDGVGAVVPKVADNRRYAILVDHSCGPGVSMAPGADPPSMSSSKPVPGSNRTRSSATSPLKSPGSSTA